MYPQLAGLIDHSLYNAGDIIYEHYCYENFGINTSSQQYGCRRRDMLCATGFHYLEIQCKTQ
ncbi:hypothetical protein CCMA1212_001332 [Trichoderma ghanense]|uniref:Uncharacterized protein n=1 Tax=Trichoderma ghanense TaxID=65468 RepID=A0ABY2HGN6_9HYPO